MTAPSLSVSTAVSPPPSLPPPGVVVPRFATLASALRSKLSTPPIAVQAARLDAPSAEITSRPAANASRRIVLVWLTLGAAVG